MQSEILKGYEEAATEHLVARFEKISSTELLAPVVDHLPQRPAQILDIGAGTGRDAAWLASLSHTVVAVEPVDALRNAGISKHTSANISWVKDTLPELSQTRALGKTYDVILLSAVWQHLDATERQTALSVLWKLTSDNGKVIMSIRDGVGAPSRPVYPADVADTVKWAEAEGFSKKCEVVTQSVQALNHQAGVTWTWLVLQA